MKKDHFQGLSTRYLVDRFVALCVAQGKAAERSAIALYNRRFDVVQALLNELRSREGDHRHRLLPLLDHPDAQVRLTAAHATLTLSPAARATLEALRKEPWLTQALDAGMALDSLDRGIYRPE
mgnify:CR=1 FL=1